MKRVTMMLALAMAVAIPAVAQTAAPEGPVAKTVVVRALQLSDQQVADWEALWAARQATVAPLRDELKTVRSDLKTLLETADPDSAKVGDLVIQAKGLRDQIGAANRAYVEGFEALLDTDQVARLLGIRKAAKVAPLVPAFELAKLVERPRHHE